MGVWWDHQNLFAALRLLVRTPSEVSFLDLRRRRGRFEVNRLSPCAAHPADEAIWGADELTVGVDGQGANAGPSRGQDRRAQTKVADELGAGAVVDDVRLGAGGGHGDRDDDCGGNEHACYDALEHGVFLSIGVCSRCGTFSKT